VLAKSSFRLCAFAGNFLVRTVSAGKGSKKFPAKAQRRKGSDTHIAFRLISYSGIFPCFLGGLVSRLFSSSDKARMSFGRVSEGSITSSMKPRSAAT
jgi:hypothetical protein